MDDLSDSGSDPLPLLPDTPEPGRPIRPMSPQPASRARGKRPPPRTAGVDLRHLLRLLYSHNPFYCVSAFLVLWGLEKSFHLHGATPRPELLMSGLAGYTLLLAAVGCLLIRAGQLWEDIRTILLLIVLIFLAISMSFDEVLSANLAAGRLYFLGGLAFSVVVSELVLRGVRLRLPILFRLPYYAMLAMFFLYPLFLGPWQDRENDPHIALAAGGLFAVGRAGGLDAVARGPPGRELRPRQRFSLAMALVSLAAVRRAGRGRWPAKLRAVRFVPSVARSGHDVRALFPRAVTAGRQYPSLGDRNSFAAAGAACAG